MARKVSGLSRNGPQARNVFGHFREACPWFFKFPIGRSGKYRNTLLFVHPNFEQALFLVLWGPTMDLQCLFKIWVDKQRVLWYFSLQPIASKNSAPLIETMPERLVLFVCLFIFFFVFSCCRISSHFWKIRCVLLSSPSFPCLVTFSIGPN